MADANPSSSEKWSHSCRIDALKWIHFICNCGDMGTDSEAKRLTSDTQSTIVEHQVAIDNDVSEETQPSAQHPTDTTPLTYGSTDTTIARGNVVNDKTTRPQPEEIVHLILDGAGNNPNFQVAVDGFLRTLNEELVTRAKRLRTVPIKADDTSIGEEVFSTKRMDIIVPCLVTARVASSIDSTMDKLKIPASHRRLLVAFHPRAGHDMRVPSTTGQLGSQRRIDIAHIVDIVFDRRDGNIFSIQENRDSIKEMAGIMD